MSFSLSEEANIDARLGWRTSFYCENTVMTYVCCMLVTIAIFVAPYGAARLTANAGKRGRSHLRCPQTFVRVAVGALAHGS